MTFLAIMTDHLRKENIDFSIKDLPEPLNIDNLFTQTLVAPQNIIIGVALQIDGHSRLAVLPVDRILHLDTLAQHTGAHKIEPLAPASFNAPFLQGCWGIPPLPSLYGLTGLIDMSVRSLEKVVIPVPCEPHVIEISANNIRRLLENEFWDDFTRLLTELIHKTGDDLMADLPHDLGLPRYTPRAMLRRLSEKHEFPVMSSTAQKILKLQADPDASVEALAAIVDESPSLAAQVIKWANSPYYGFPGTIRSTKDAIIKVLGFDLILNMALGIAIGSTFETPIEGPIGLRQYWQHSICCAALNERLAKLIPARKRPLVGLAYLTGLLHNFGMLLMGEVFPKHFQLTNRLIPVNPHLSILDVEHCVLGVAHDQIGSWLMEAWHMPPELIVTTRHHHWLEPIDALDNAVKPYVALTHISVNLLAQRHLGDGVSTRISESALQILDLNLEQIEETLKNIEQDIPQLMDIADHLIQA